MGLLAASVGLPAALGLLLLAVPALGPRAARALSVGGSLAALGLLVAAASRWRPGGPELLEEADWIPFLGISFRLGADGVSLALALLTAALQPLAALASASAVRDRERVHHALLLVLESGMLATFLARDLFLFYVAWELTLVPMFFLIGLWGGPERRSATIRFVLFTAAGSLPMLVGILALAIRSGPSGPSAWDFAFPGPGTAARLGLSLGEERLLLLAFGVAFAVKLPLVPFHSWLPLAHVEAPTAGSMILAGVLLKMGGYGFLRFGWPVFPGAMAEAAPILAVLGVAGILHGSLCALAQQDLKRLVAYSSIAHLGVAALGIATGTEAGLAGALFVMVAHGFGTGSLFALVGVLHERRHSRDLGSYGGLASRMPLAAAAFGLASFSSVGLPGLAGFVGEILVLLAAAPRFPALVPLAACGVVLSAAYMLRAVRVVFLGPETEGPARDLTRVEAALLAPALALLVLLGVRPGILLDATRPDIAKLAAPSGPAGPSGRAR